MEKVSLDNNMDNEYPRKIAWKPGNMLYPLPAVLVTTSDGKGRDNVFTVAWAGTICTNPPMVSISVKESRYSHELLMQTKEFVINLTTEKMTFAVDYCGVRSGRDEDKFEKTGLTKLKAPHVCAPMIAESPVCIECRVTEVRELGSHDMFLAEVVGVHVDPQYVDEQQKFHLEKADPIVYSHGDYFSLGKKKGRFGYSVAKKTKNRKKAEKIKKNK